MNKDNIIAIIPARSGSKSIARKNLVKLGGKPLVSWPIELALSVDKIDRVIVSTNDNEIMSVAVSLGAEAPFKRPDYLAKDETPTLPVLQHAIRYIESHENYKPDIILLLYPTTPFLRKKRIQQALDLFEKTRCNSVMGYQEDLGRLWKYYRGKYRPFYNVERNNRQFIKPLYREAGNIYFSRYEVIMKLNKIVDENSIRFIKIENDENIDIDTPEDLRRARNILKQKGKD